MILPFKIIRTRSTSQMMFQPKIKRNNAATIFPSASLVTKPKINAVTGIIAKIMLKILFHPK